MHVGCVFVWFRLNVSYSPGAWDHRDHRMTRERGGIKTGVGNYHVRLPVLQVADAVVNPQSLASA
jgi:hypothetical protein